jgi:hypothetical protein
LFVVSLENEWHRHLHFFGNRFFLGTKEEPFVLCFLLKVTGEEGMTDSFQWTCLVREHLQKNPSTGKGKAHHFSIGSGSG